MAPVEIAEELFFIQRGYLNANHFVWRGEPPVLIDTGYKAGYPETLRHLQALGVSPQQVGLIVNTHCHCDHVGGNRRIQEASGCGIAVHRVGKHFIDSRDDWATWWRYYRQDADFFTCTRGLEDGDRLRIGPHRFEVIYTPGHAADGIVLYCKSARILISSDTLWENDMAVMTLPVEGSRALLEMADSLDRIASLAVETVYPGHGAPFRDFAGAVERTRTRIEGFLADRKRIGADVMKKIMIYTLLMHRQVAADRFFDLLQGAPWFGDTVRRYFGQGAREVYDRFLSELEARGLVIEDGGMLTTSVPP
ncbi:MAG: MBL fold metallo-hydrolase [Desulfobacterales bacterium]|jgi:glyoxylase-like metal-dependent hydrolase (beta-lactamase superfamily II)